MKLSMNLNISGAGFRLVDKLKGFPFGSLHPSITIAVRNVSSALTINCLLDGVITPAVTDGTGHLSTPCSTAGTLGLIAMISLFYLALGITMHD